MNHQSQNGLPHSGSTQYLRLLLTPAILSIVALTAAACNTATDPSKQSTELDTQRNVWRAKNSTDYRFTFNWSCFCIPTYVRPVRITVREGEIRQVVYADDNSPVDPQQWDEYRTIEQLFDFLAEAYAKPAFSVEVTYNAPYGYPENAYVDYSAQIADEEKGFQITGFEVLP